MKTLISFEMVTSAIITVDIPDGVDVPNLIDGLRNNPEFWHDVVIPQLVEDCNGASYNCTVDWDEADNGYMTTEYEELERYL